jgi:hypothetical protein
MLARPRTALTVRLSLSAMMKILFPASAIFRSCSSSSGFQGRLALRAPKIISSLYSTTANKDGWDQTVKLAADKTVPSSSKVVGKNTVRRVRENQPAQNVQVERRRWGNGKMPAQEHAR